jgi:hypothetical protein
MRRAVRVCGAVPVSLALLCVSLAAPAQGGASITAATTWRSPALAVDAKGNALVTWTQSGARRTLLIPPSGRYLPGGRLSGPDVSKPAAANGLAYARLVRRTPDGRLWALQAWRVHPGGPAELRFARWQGEPTSVLAELAAAKLTGTATYAGKGVFGTSPTTAGTQIRHFAYVDCDRCPGSAGWSRMLSVPLTGPRGSYAVTLFPKRRGSRYRVSVTGPNRGWAYAPDATVVVAATP